MFISCPDYVAARGMRILGNPLGDDAKIISGESGGVTIGMLSQIMKDENLKEVRELLHLDKNSKILSYQPRRLLLLNEVKVGDESVSDKGRF
jgi:diaminopropionate ammonia-lyase